MEEKKFDFDKKAASWDDKPMRVKLAKQIAGAMLGEKIITPGMDILEFGCGTGLVTMELSPMVHSVTGMDSSQGMLSVLEAKIQERGLTNVKTELLDPSMGGVIEGAYHAVVSSMALHHVKDIDALFAQFHRALVPGGRLLLADLDPEGGRFHGGNPAVFHNGFERKELAKILVEIGFCEVRDKTAAVVEKPLAEGGLGSFSIFLITSRKKG